MDEIKLHDSVFVAGEGNEVFTVVGIEGSRVLLHTGWYEPIKKCTKVKDLTSIYCTVTNYSDERE